MRKKWDYDVPAVEVWQECLRVLKPGGHLLAFAGTRTQHRMAVRIEDAGFEIRDMIAWVYGSGFPKSLDVSKAIDKAAGAERKQFQVNHFDDTRNVKFSGNAGIGCAICGCTTVVSSGLKCGHPKNSAPATEAAKQWQGWGTALKPSLEPITVARAPLTGTVAENVLQHGTGALNVDGCRVGDESGRFPANLIHDGSEEVVGLFPESNGQQGKVTGKEPSSEVNSVYGDFNGRPATAPRGDTGSAARFFYCAKADAAERRNSKHPTIKPVALMRYLVRLVCPAGGVVLDPFAGSGTTIEAARLEHCRAIGIEREAEYCADILERLRQGVLF
jgi:site-specific DNA-methyltransferase (adenine-specific)